MKLWSKPGRDYAMEVRAYERSARDEDPFVVLDLQGTASVLSLQEAEHMAEAIAAWVKVQREKEA